MCPDEDDLPGRDQITLKDAYLAMYYFVDAYWKRGGRGDGSVTLLRHAIGPAADPHDETALHTNDPASWSDWLAAVRVARANGLHGWA